MEHQDDLGVGLYQLVLGQYTAVVWKATKAWVDENQVVTGGEESLSLADTDSLMLPNGLTLSGRLPMERSTQMHLLFLVAALLRPDQPATLGLTTLGTDMGDQEMDLEEYTPGDHTL